MRCTMRTAMEIMAMTIIDMTMRTITPMRMTRTATIMRTKATARRAIIRTRARS